MSVYFIAFEKYIHINVFKWLKLLCVWQQHAKCSILSAAPSESESWRKNGVLWLKDNEDLVGRCSEWSNVGFLKKTNRKWNHWRRASKFAPLSNRWWNAFKWLSQPRTKLDCPSDYSSDEFLSSEDVWTLVTLRPGLSSLQIFFSLYIITLAWLLSYVPLHSRVQQEARKSLGHRTASKSCSDSLQGRQYSSGQRWQSPLGLAVPWCSTHSDSD